MPQLHAARSVRDYVLECTNDELYGKVSRLILEFAILGYSKTAHRLLNHISQHNIYHVSENFVRALWFLWDLLERTEGKAWPVDERRRLGRAIQTRRRETGGQAHLDPIEEGKFNEDFEPTAAEIQSELQVMAQEYAARWFYPNKPTYSNQPQLTPYYAGRKLLTAKRKLHSARFIINHFKYLFKSPTEQDIQSGLVNALGLTLSAQADMRLSDNEETVSNAEHSLDAIHILGWITQNLNIRYLVESREAWVLLKEGALRRLLNVDDEKLSRFSAEFEDAVVTRISTGRRRPQSHSLNDLLDTIQRTTKDRSSKFKNMRPFLKDPATQEQIDNGEDALGIKLPDDYKCFLHRSNGSGLFCGRAVGDFEPPLHSVNELRWLEDDEDYFTDLPLNIPGDWDRWSSLSINSEQSNFKPKTIDCPAHFSVGKALEIGTEGINNTWLIPPSSITAIKKQMEGIQASSRYTDRKKESINQAIMEFAGDQSAWESMDWCCMTWAAGGSAIMTVHPSFKAYLEHIAEHGKGRTNDDVLKALRNGKQLGTIFAEEGATKCESPTWLKSAQQISRERYAK